MICRYDHHKENGKETKGTELGKCPVHKESLILCGPFTHVCLKCSPVEARRCGICGVVRWECCC